MAKRKNPTRCVIIGAGVSGILMACKLRDGLPDDVHFQIIEKNKDVGGTWYENRYPGCACDVPSHIYQFSFAPSPYWSRYYASSAEIQKYLKAVCTHYRLQQYIRFSSTVTKAMWDEERSVWQVEVDHSEHLECDVLINGGGILNNPQFPDITGFEQFKGILAHTAAWDPDIELREKKVAIIGAGASAVQVLPMIQPIVQHVDIYIRTPSWISPPAGIPNHPPDYTQEDIQHFLENPDAFHARRKNMENIFNKMYSVFFKNSQGQLEIRKMFEDRMRELIKSKSLQHQLIPSFEVGCRRINPGEQYLETLQEANVEPVFEPIDCISTTGIVVAGTTRPVDIIILATGFDTTFRPRFPIVGRGSRDLRDLWESSPEGYFGIGISGFPNYLTFLGPNTPISNGSLLGSMEATADYFLRLMKRMRAQGAASFDVRDDVQADFNKHTQAFMEQMVWTGTCRSWFKKSVDSKVTALWPGSSLHYIETLQQDRWEDYEWKYHGNRFAYWGDGSSSTDRQQEGADYSHYLKHHPLLPLESFEDKDMNSDGQGVEGNGPAEKAGRQQRLGSVAGFSV